ncbi:MAG TPA: 2-oxoglutarate dehydrogenase E1 component [Rhodanobacteraceae bacterium]|nr:2-oxoglutarate dehydrogenase E1 component [Rhodanobacteraceae bacterium]
MSDSDNQLQALSPQQFFESSQLGGGNAGYVEQLYEDWLRDPQSVPQQWRAYFDGFRGRNDVPHSDAIARIERAQKLNGHARAALISASPVDEAHARKQAGVLRLLTAFRSRGHLAADLDPLAIAPKMPAPDLDLPFHGLAESDLDTVFDCGTFAGGGQRMKLRELRDRLRATYARTIGAEFMHISDVEQRRWIYSRLEKMSGDPGLTADERKRVLHKLTAAEGLERYLHTKYVGQKRFSLEGGDSLIPLLDDLVRRAASQGVRELVIGMAHRGRLNVLVNTLGKPPQKLFEEFEGKFDHPDDPAHSGDVKYHMGFSADIATPSANVHLALAFNPSHLEIVNPVVAGSVRARQTRVHDGSHGCALPVLIHGDAALSGQGVNMELFNMSQTRGFRVGGTVHVVVNNQIGFTTPAWEGRSTLYCTDVAKMVNAPVLHVNGDDPEAVLQCARLAFDFRQAFHKDVVIDLVCYRRHGHNEADEPAATQPVMYAKIKQTPTTRELYARRLVEAKLIGADDAQKAAESYRERLEAGKPVTELAEPGHIAKTQIDWSRYAHGTLAQAVATGVERKLLDQLAGEILQVPDGTTLQSRVAKIYDDRRKMSKGELPLDWGYAENMAYATLIAQNYALRLVGQDAGRGTFFHRHAELHDQKSGNVYTPLQHVRQGVSVEIIDSLLSEEAVMAFEYGYATADPDTLVLWEAQFGDFANGAQVVVDQFISSGESKWGRLCGLVLLLPHGYEGQGPEHSSARLERYLQLCALDNMQVCVPTTPAQMFHMLRRQMLREARKPLVVMTPKSLLRHKLAISSLDDLANGTFQLVIPDSRIADAKKVKRVVLCSGKVYYDLFEAAEKDKLKDVALVRVEQLYPFPRQEVIEQLARYPQAREVIWCQEEPMNQGAWFQIRHHLQACIGANHSLHYAGRARSPAPAAGHYNTHVVEQNALVAQALGGKVGDDHSLE